MAKKGYITEAMNGGRIVAHGQITDLSFGFKLPHGELFSVFIRPKTQVSTLDTVLSVKCQQDDDCERRPCCVQRLVAARNQGDCPRQRPANHL